MGAFNTVNIYSYEHGLTAKVLNAVINHYGSWKFITPDYELPVIGSHILHPTIRTVMLEMSVMTNRYLNSMVKGTYEIVAGGTAEIVFEDSKLIAKTNINKTNYKTIDDLADELSKDMTFLVNKEYGNRVKAKEVLIGVDETAIELAGDSKEYLRSELLLHSWRYGTFDPDNPKTISQWENVCFIVNMDKKEIRLGTMNSKTGELLRVYYKNLTLSQSSWNKIMMFAEEYLILLDDTLRKIIDKVDAVG